jgi:hypothetical protein
MHLRVYGLGVFTCRVTSWQHKIWLFLGAVANLRKAAISVVISVCPSVRIEQLGSHWTEFHEIWYLSIFRKSVEKIQVSLKSNKNKRYCT